MNVNGPERLEGIRIVEDLARRLVSKVGNHAALPDHALDWGIELGVRIALERPEYSQALALKLGRFRDGQYADIDEWIAANPMATE